MLIPAAVRKDEIVLEFKKKYYSEEMFYYTGALDNSLPNISDCPGESTFQYAIVDEKNEKLLGYVAYTIDWYTSCAYNFGLMSFDEGNPLIGKALYEIFQKILPEKKIHRVEYRMISGNPIQRNYDKFCESFNGNKYVLHDILKDSKGIYRDEYIYELFLDGTKDTVKND